MEHANSQSRRLVKVITNAAAIRAIVARHGAANPRVFGSTARGEDGPSSDIDILVEMLPMMSLLDLVHIHDDLEELLGESVDVLVDSTISPARRAVIDREAIGL